MKKILALILMIALTFNSAFAEWNVSLPGTTAASDIDARVTENYVAAQQTVGGLTGWKNLAVSYTTAASVTVTADQLYLQSATLLAYRATTVSEVITITTAGASGLVTSLSEASGTWYYVWIARKSSDGTTNGYLSTTADFTTFLTQVDSGYDQAALVSAVRNNGSSDFISFKQNGRRYNYSSWQSMASGNVGLGTWVSIDTTAFVPSSLSNFCYGKSQTESLSVITVITNDNTVSATDTIGRNKIGSNGQQAPFWQLDIITANTLWWISSDGTNGVVYMAGFDINKL